MIVEIGDKMRLDRGSIPLISTKQGCKPWYTDIFPAGGNQATEKDMWCYEVPYNC